MNRDMAPKNYFEFNFVRSQNGNKSNYRVAPQCYAKEVRKFLVEHNYNGIFCK